MTDWEKNERWKDHALEFANRYNRWHTVLKERDEGGGEAKMKNLNTYI